MEIEVKGHSGCCIEIIRDGNEYYIEKSTRDVKYCHRLLAQFEKQSKAQDTNHIHIPKIISIDSSDSAVIGRMEYIYSQNFIDYFETSGYEDLSFFVKQIIVYLENEIANSPVTIVSKSIVWDKFESVCNIVSKNPLLSGDDSISLLLQQSSTIFEALPTQLTLPVGICHGDLTFSNILFNRDGLFLIDFLDSFIETPLMDIVKLRQDSAYGWSKLMYSGDFDDTRLKIISSQIDNQLVQFSKQFTWYNEYYQAFQLMNFLRILQYAKDVKVIEYLKKIINQIMKGDSNEF